VLVAARPFRFRDRSVAGRASIRARARSQRLFRAVVVGVRFAVDYQRGCDSAPPEFVEADGVSATKREATARGQQALPADGAPILASRCHLN